MSDVVVVWNGEVDIAFLDCLVRHQWERGSKRARQHNSHPPGWSNTSTSLGDAAQTAGAPSAGKHLLLEMILI
jgi:hypothetical protein